MLFAAVLIIGTAAAGYGWLRVRNQRKAAQAK